MVGSSLGVFKDHRHKYQTSVVDMIGDVLSGAEEAMKGKIAEADAKISTGDSMQSAREVAVEEAKATQ